MNVDRFREKFGLKKIRLLSTGSLIFLFVLFSGFSITSSKSEGRSFPLPGSFDEVWNATIETLKAEKIPLTVEDKVNGYIQSATFPLYKKEYKGWAKAPSISSRGFCMIEVGVVEKDSTMTVVGIRAYFKRKSGLSSRGIRNRDASRGIFEGLLAGRIHERLVGQKFPKMRGMVMGCNLHYDDKTAHYMITEAERDSLAYEQGLRNGDYLYKIDGQEITPGNLFEFFTSVEKETLRKFTVVRGKETIDIPVVLFYLDPNGPHFGFRAERDEKTGKFIVKTVRGNSPAQEAGLLPGDVLIQQNDFSLDSWKNYYRAILAEEGGLPQTFKIERSGRVIEKVITPAVVAAEVEKPV